MIILHSIESILSIIIMILIGYILAGKGYIKEDSSRLLSKLVCSIALPAYMVQNLVSNFTKEKLSEMSSGLIMPFLSIFISYIIGILVANIIKVPEGKKGTFISMFFVSNTIFIGLPVNMALFGEKSVPYVLLYYIANTVFFWTIGVYSISKDGDGKDVSLFSLQSLKKILSPPLLGFIVGIILVLLNIKLPKFVLDTCKYLGNLTTPLSMIFIGTSIRGVNLKEIKFTKDMLAIVLGRFMVSPLIVIFLASFSNAPLLMKEVFVIQASMPIMTQTSIIAKAYNADYKYAAIMTTITTILAVISIPIYMLILDKIQYIL